MLYPTKKNDVLLRRLGAASGRHTPDGRTGRGTMDIVIPEMPEPPASLTPEEKRREIEKWNRWRESLAGQFPIPVAPLETPPPAP
jgi:hypothetical protein